MNEYRDGEYLVREHENGAVERILISEHLPEPPVRHLTRLQFRNRFTSDEKVAIYTAAESSVQLRIFLDDVNAAEEINLDDAATIAGLQALESAGLIGVGRATEILGGA